MIALNGKCKENLLADKLLYLLDIDGTIAFDSTLIEGTMSLLNHVNEIGGKYIFITNNSTKSIEDYICKFNKLGVPVDKTSFLTSSYATAIYLVEHYFHRLLYVVGTKSFIDELKSFGLQVTEEKAANIEAAVVGFDNELTYHKIETICELLFTQDVDYIATNPDLACPTGFGFIPDCGAICDMIAKATQRTPRYIGKPNSLMIDLALKSTGFTKEQTIVIGDRLYTDIACGLRGGVDTAVVFTGEAKIEDLEETEFVPRYYADSILEIYECVSLDL